MPLPCNDRRHVFLVAINVNMNMNCLALSFPGYYFSVKIGTWVFMMTIQMTCKLLSIAINFCYFLRFVLFWIRLTPIYFKFLSADLGSCKVGQGSGKGRWSPPAGHFHGSATAPCGGQSVWNLSTAPRVEVRNVYSARWGRKYLWSESRIYVANLKPCHWFFLKQFQINI